MHDSIDIPALKHFALPELFWTIHISADSSIKTTQNTVLTRHYSPFYYKPPLTICNDLLQRYIYLQFMPSSAIHGKFNERGRTLRLWQTRGRLELTVPPYIQSSYLLASNTPNKRLATWWQARSYIAGAKTASCLHTLQLHWFMILYPAELSHFELHHKPYKTVMNNSTIAVSLVRFTARKGAYETNYHYSII